jgi:hypothetical protein
MVVELKGEAHVLAVSLGERVSRATSRRARTSAGAAVVGIATQEAGATRDFSANDEYMSTVPMRRDVAIWLHQPGSWRRQRGARAITLSGQSCCEWTPQERTRLDAMLRAAGAAPRADLAPWLPERVQIARFRTESSSGADFTRGSTIFLSGLKPTDEAMDERFFHELFHVISRSHEARRHEFYAIVGFEVCTPLVLDDALRARVLTNPDAPIVEYASQVQINNRSVWATPLMVADLTRYTPRSDLFDHVELQFLALSRDASGRCVADASSTLTQAELGAAVVARAGGNTNYVLHPEELVADNFAQMMMGRRAAPSPEVYNRLATLLNIERPSTRE